MKTTKTLMTILWLNVIVAIAQGLNSGSLFARADDKTKKITEVYAAIYQDFYGAGKALRMYKGALDMLPDGTPHIVFNRESRTAEIWIRLSVNDTAYAAWKTDTKKRMVEAGFGDRIVTDNNSITRGEIIDIGEQRYRFDENESSALIRWESSDAASKATLFFRIELVDGKGNPVRKFDAGQFWNHRWPLNIEPMTKYCTFTDLTDEEMNAIVDVKCSIIDDEIIRKEVEDASRHARAASESARLLREQEEFKLAEPVVRDIISGMVAIPGTDYKIGKTEVTRGQWAAVMGIPSTASQSSPSDCPVVNISFQDCANFLYRLNAMPVVKDAGMTFRLPTKDELYYAYKGGSTNKYAYCKLAGGTEIQIGELKGPVVDRVMWAFDRGNDMYGDHHYDYVLDSELHPVGQKEPNAFGLYDIFGNADELTQSLEDTYSLICVVWGSWGGRFEFNDMKIGAQSKSQKMGLRLCADSEAENAVQSIATNMVAIPGKSYLMCKFEVTKSQWESVMGFATSWEMRWDKSDCAAREISWEDCQAFIRRINDLPSTKKVGLVFRLPTTEEWQYAGRAGSTKDHVPMLLADGTELTSKTLGRVACLDHFKEKKPGTREPNAFGLYDMLGNVSEWTQSANGENFDCLGGSVDRWSEVMASFSLHARRRPSESPTTRGQNTGFRLCADRLVKAKQEGSEHIDH